MNRVGILGVLSDALMEAFSSRTIDRLRQRKRFALLLPPLEPFLSINVQKEIRKNRLVIDAAASRADVTDMEIVASLLKSAREIDADFLDEASSHANLINIPLHAIEPIRHIRTERVLQLCRHILSAWQATPHLRTVMPAICGRDEFRMRLQGILDLYGEETRILANSASLPPGLSALRDTLARALQEEMKQVSRGLSGTATAYLYPRT